MIELDNFNFRYMTLKSRYFIIAYFNIFYRITFKKKEYNIFIVKKILTVIKIKPISTVTEGIAKDCGSINIESPW